MKKIITLGCAIALLSLSACGVQKTGDTNTGSTENKDQKPKVETSVYETNQKETPATKYCEKNGGTVSFETITQGEFTREDAYCTIEGEKKDAWKYMDEATSATGETNTGSEQ